MPCRFPELPTCVLASFVLPDEGRKLLCSDCLEGSLLKVGVLDVAVDGSRAGGQFAFWCCKSLVVGARSNNFSEL